MNDFDDEDEARRPLVGSSAAGGFSVKDARVEVRLAFLRKVYSLLCVQLLVTMVIAGLIVASAENRLWLRSNEWLLWLSVFGTMSTICVLACCEKAVRRFPTNYIFLFTFTAFEAIMIGFVSAMFTWQSLMLAVGVTAFIFLALTLFSFNTTRDFTGYGPYLFVALLTLCVFGLLLMILPTFGVDTRVGTLLYDCIAVILFSFYIIFDTQLMLGAYGGHAVELAVDDYVFAALHLYLDVVNLFVAVLSLLGRRDSGL